MNLYHKKQRWKIVLLIVAILLVAASLWFSNTIVKKVAQREVDRVEQWADAVKRKADLVNLTNNAFEELRQNERRKVELWTTAMVEVNKDLNDYTLVVAILQENGGNVPLIITDQLGKVESTHNLEFLDSMIIKSLPTKKVTDSIVAAARYDSLVKFTKEWPKTHAPLTIDLYAGKRQIVYYYDSKKLMDLELRKDSLFHAFNEELLANEYLVPVLFIDRDSREIIGTNMKNVATDSVSLVKTIKALGSANDSIVVDLGASKNGVIYFEHSPELKQLKYFPIVQFIIIGLFIFIGYVIFSTFRKAEQDQVWAGMAKETAHQLGTPISSLMAWIQLLEADGVNVSTITEMNKDVDRLNTITNRFSKIGSKAVLKTENIVPIISESVEYLRHRISSQIELKFESTDSKIQADVNASLVEWVIENITKNAVDAMEGKGKILVSVKPFEDDIYIDIVDNGKGIPPAKLKTVFQPGYTTKTRGWGLGLSLVKRIVEEFHKGKIFVLKSEVGVGTTFRIVLKAK
ncbi:MAG: ATP-binding protein [Putridiphycobacter sp.]|nr:ATP-binding protein [Putridiphycobacter sp.]